MVLLTVSLIFNSGVNTMRLILAMTAASFVLIGCDSLDSIQPAAGGNGGGVGTCQQIVTKTGVVERC